MTSYLQQRGLYPPFIFKRPSPLLGIVVVIPCHDEDFLLLSLMALKKCKRPTCDVEVIIVVNHGEHASERIKSKNQKCYEQALQWALDNNQPHLKFYPLLLDDLSKKHAGVGLARKIGMDEACYRFEKIFNPKGIIACFDADSRCDTNYLQALEAHFKQNPAAMACGIYFEHPLSGPDYPEEVYAAIVQYELHLRYYVQAQRWAGIPHAWHTIGSSMAVRCDAYQQQGGMNRRQAGEDFYFLHKFIPLGHFGEITTTKITPSPRPSQRVPFGTGRAVGDMLNNGGDYKTYNPLSFQDLKLFVDNALPALVQPGLPGQPLEAFPDSIRQFLLVNDFEAKLAEIQSNTSHAGAFFKRFWQWFDAFMVMKYVHFARENFYPDLGVGEAADWLLGKQGARAEAASASLVDQLKLFREMDKKPRPALAESKHA
jgi:hypothetical protein